MPNVQGRYTTCDGSAILTFPSLADNRNLTPMSQQPRSIVEAFEPLLPEVTPEETPMLLAILERLAADKYRDWADQTEDAVESEGLLACARREDEIAEFIESLESDPKARGATLHARFPDLRQRYDSVMHGLSREEQLRVQAEGELGGADYMRQFAAATQGAVAARFESLVLCEETNAKFLSKLTQDA